MSWIPSQAVTGLTRGAFESGLTHYDKPPPDQISGPEWLHEAAKADVFRFANHLSVTVQVSDGHVASGTYDDASELIMGGSTLRAGPWSLRVAAIPYPTIQHEPVISGESVTFLQTAGGRAGMIAPRPVSQPPYAQIASPAVWTTLRLTVHADGTVESELVGASMFPRHWVYGRGGNIFAKSGTMDSGSWMKASFGKHTPWGTHDSPVLVAAAESALERAVSREVMTSGHKPIIRSMNAGTEVTKQGAREVAMFLVLDGIVDVDVSGQHLGELGPGALVGERAFLEGGRRTATLIARTNIRVAMFPPDEVDREALNALRAAHHLEDREPQTP